MTTQTIRAAAQPQPTVLALPLVPAQLHLPALEAGYELEQRSG